MESSNVSRSETESEDHDLEGQQHLPDAQEAGVRDPLCRLATNKDGEGVQGKWRLIGAICLCTLFMVRIPADFKHDSRRAVTQLS